MFSIKKSHNECKEKVLVLTALKTEEFFAPVLRLGFIFVSEE
jgi:hypothetical protein